MKILLRGHIRNSFDDNNLYNLLKSIDIQIGIELYIHTWNIVSSGLSWRGIKPNHTHVNKEMIHRYFRDLTPKIKVLMIDNEQSVVLKGRTQGLISITRMPIKGWKYMLHGMFRLIEFVHNIIPDKNEKILITRFDILNNHCNITPSYMENYIRIHAKTDAPILFSNGTANNREMGCDNILLGRASAIYRLIHMLHTNLDEVLTRHPRDVCQEFYFVYEHNYMMTQKDDNDKIIE
jgi:hypothetical protein